MSEQKKQNLADPSVRKGFITYLRKQQSFAIWD